jgi:hypothetical protein
MTSESLRRAVFASETMDGLLACLTISHPDLTEDINVVANGEDITSNGVGFVAFGFDLIFPNDTAASPPVAKLSIDNVSREISQAIRTISTAPTVHIFAVKMSDHDYVEMTFPNFKLRNVTIDGQNVSGDLSLEDLTHEPYPCDIFSPAAFPGLLQ